MKIRIIIVKSWKQRMKESLDLQFSIFSRRCLMKLNSNFTNGIEIHWHWNKDATNASHVMSELGES